MRNEREIYMFCNPEDFEFELAKRTIVNLNNIDRQYVQQKAAGKKDTEITDVYEVTQLLNSFIGLLVIPREKFLKYGNLWMPPRFVTKEAQDLLRELNAEKNKPSKRFYTTYKNKNGNLEQLNPWTISRHLRNAISHDSLDIQPQTVKEGDSITGFVFKDKDPKTNDRFMLALTIKEIRLLLIEMANLILSQFPERFEPLSLEYLEL